MAERVVDSAFSDGVGTATFFLTDQYVVYDYVADRARDGVHPVTSFPPGAATGFPAAFAPGGPATLIDAALPGKHRFAGLTYFFGRDEYLRFVNDAGVFDPANARPVAGNWTVPAGVTRYSAAWNGALNRDAFCYLFQGGQYLRYRWDEDRTDAGFPKPINNMIGIPADFATGIDAAVDGAAAFASRSYFFRGDTYLRFQWVSTGEPHSSGTGKIQDGWPGLMELLLAAKAKSHALTWLAAARRSLAQQAAGTIGAPEAAVLAAALLAHFKTTPADTASLATIDGMLGQVEGTLRDSARRFRFRTPAEVASDGAGVSDAAYTWPLPVGSSTRINITRHFPGRPELNRVSSIIHEAVHANDDASATPDVHISEWYVSPALAPGLGLTPVADMPTTTFATRYDLMGTAASLHNPSSYATFARHVFFGHDSRENI